MGIALLGYNLVMLKTIDVSDLPKPLIDAIESLVNTYRQSANAEGGDQNQTPPIGWLKGKWELPESFFQPLPDDVIELFNGGGEPV